MSGPDWSAISNCSTISPGPTSGTANGSTAGSAGIGRSSTGSSPASRWPAGVRDRIRFRFSAAGKYSIICGGACVPIANLVLLAVSWSAIPGDRLGSHAGGGLAVVLSPADAGSFPCLTSRQSRKNFSAAQADSRSPPRNCRCGPASASGRSWPPTPFCGSAYRRRISHRGLLRWTSAQNFRRLVPNQVAAFVLSMLPLSARAARRGWALLCLEAGSSGRGVSVAPGMVRLPARRLDSQHPLPLRGRRRFFAFRHGPRIPPHRRPQNLALFLGFHRRFHLLAAAR